MNFEKFASVVKLQISMCRIIFTAQLKEEITRGGEERGVSVQLRTRLSLF